MVKKRRVDQLLVERKLAEDLDSARRMIMAGEIRADGQLIHNPSRKIPPGAGLEINPGALFVSRGGEKLAAALLRFPVRVEGKICADVGSSTGGFTDCLLQNGAARVYAVDVGYGELAWELRKDERVVVMERTNARRVKQLPETIELLVVDVSFISLKTLWPVFTGWFPDVGSQVIALIKPQFEASREESARGKGVILDAEIHQRVLIEVLEAAQSHSYRVRGLIPSPLYGPDGNREFLAWLDWGGDSTGLALLSLIDRALSTEKAGAGKDDSP